MESKFQRDVREIQTIPPSHLELIADKSRSPALANRSSVWAAPQETYLLPLRRNYSTQIDLWGRPRIPAKKKRPILHTRPRGAMLTAWSQSAPKVEEPPMELQLRNELHAHFQLILKNQSWK